MIQHVGTRCALAAMLAAVAACERVPTTTELPPLPAERIEPVDNSRPLPASPPSSAPILVQFASHAAREPLLRDASIRLNVTDGRARLIGFVPSAAAKHRADEIARQLLGLSIIDNRLIVRPDAGVARTPLASAPIYL